MRPVKLIVSTLKSLYDLYFMCCSPGTLMSGLSVLFLMSVMNMFLGSALLFKVTLNGGFVWPDSQWNRVWPSPPPHALQAHMYLGLIIMCGFVLFDTQLIIEKAENGDKDYIWWALLVTHRWQHFASRPKEKVVHSNDFYLRCRNRLVQWCKSLMKKLKSCLFKYDNLWTNGGIFCCFEGIA